jgi:hypothetical protein
MSFTVNREDLRGELRIALGDTNESSPKWTDADLNQCINWSIDLHTWELPFAANVEVAASGNSYDFPELAVSLWRVYGDFGQGVNEFVGEADRTIFFGYWTQGDEPVCFIPHFPEAGKYYLPKAPSGSFTLYYGTRRAALDDDQTDLDLGHRSWSKEAIVKLAGHYAFDPKSTGRAGLEQWAQRIDLPVDNPLEQEADRWLAQYDRLME